MSFFIPPNFLQQNTIVKNDDSNKKDVVSKSPIFTIVNKRKPTSLVDYAVNYPPIYWKELFNYALADIQHVEYNFQRWNITKYYPPTEEVFNAYEKTPLMNTNVVIFGQDPYHGPGQANGLAFSVHRGIPIPPSLMNIYKELKREYGDEFVIPSHGDLTYWALQGVLLLNTTLTVSPGQPNSHAGFWMGFIDKTIEYILRTNPQCVFMLWGGEARKLLPKLGELSYKLISSHPSPLGVSKGSKDCKAFNQSDHFILANEFLQTIGKSPIDWRVPE